MLNLYAKDRTTARVVVVVVSALYILAFLCDTRRWAQHRSIPLSNEGGKGGSDWNDDDYDYFQYGSFQVDNRTSRKEDLGKYVKEVVDTLNLPSPPCGNWKCAFQAKSSNDDDDRAPSSSSVGPRGYLIVPNRKTGRKPTQPTIFETMSKGYQLAMHLQQRFGADNFRHLFLGPPVLVECSNPEQAAALKSQFMGNGHDARKFFTHDITYTIQPITMIQNFVELKFRQWEGYPPVNQSEELLDMIRAASESSEYSVVARRFVTQLDVAAEILRLFPLYARDFQLFVGGDGTVFHIDLDRVYLLPGLFDDKHQVNQTDSGAIGPGSPRFHQIWKSAFPTMENYKREIRLALLGNGE